MPGGGSGFLDVQGAPLHGGTYVTLVPPNDLSAMTVIIETMADSSCLSRNLSYFNVTFTTRDGLPGPGTVLHVWASTQDALFVEQPSVTIGLDSRFTVLVAPDSLITVSTIANASHGGFPNSPIPPPVSLLSAIRTYTSSYILPLCMRTSYLCSFRGHFRIMIRLTITPMTVWRAISLTKLEAGQLEMAL